MSHLVSTIDIRPHNIVKINDFHPTSYFQIKGEPIVSLTLNSRINAFEICSTETYQHNVFPVEEVTLPFTFPIAMPLSLE
jgi:hypothetical protein